LADSQDAILFRRRARRRLVGAIALVVFVVVVLPLVLDQGQRPTTQSLTVQIPSQNAGPFKTPVAPPLAAQAVPSTKSEPASAPEGGPKAGKPESRPVAPAARTPPEARDGAKPATKESQKTRLAEARRAQALLNDMAYYVPLGAFVSPDNARHVQDKATAAGIGSYTEKLKSPQGEQTRVRAGPFASKEAAEKARETLRSAGLAVGQVAKR
jgi:DedD protein